MSASFCRHLFFFLSNSFDEKKRKEAFIGFFFVCSLTIAVFWSILSGLYTDIETDGSKGVRGGMLRVVTKDNECEMSARHWQSHLEKVEYECVASQKAVEFASFAKDSKWIGYNARKGQIRPGKLGQWDLYLRMYRAGHSEEDCLAVTGLTRWETAQFCHDLYLQGRSVDLVNPRELGKVREFGKLVFDTLSRLIGRLRQRE